MTKLFLFDIEGTTTDISFVHKTLFPYSEKFLEEYVLQHQDHPVVISAIQGVKQTVLDEEKKDINLSEVIMKLKDWIRTDRKHKSLKDIQGLVWDMGYSRGDFKGHLYPDVKPFFRKILDKGGKIGIYSSGSVHAQKLIFGFSEEGDVTPLISYYFDTSVGHKREKASYLSIATKVNLKPSDIHFFSDIEQELSAAKSAGLTVTHVIRPGTEPNSYPSIKDFSSFTF